MASPSMIYDLRSTIYDDLHPGTIFLLSAAAGLLVAFPLCSINWSSLEIICRDLVFPPPRFLRKKEAIFPALIDFFDFKVLQVQIKC